MAVGWIRGALIAGAALAMSPAAASAQGSNGLVLAPDTKIDDGVLVEQDYAGEAGTRRRFVLEPSLHWRGSNTITYYNTAGKYREQVKKAAAAWNKSGAKVNWKPVSRASAKVIIEIEPNLPTQGQATTNGTTATILLQEDLLTQFPPKDNSKAITTAIIDHEMGHVMGLGHEPRKCATMNANLWFFCDFPKEAWQYRCRPLEPDDVRGGVKAFGGRPGNLGRPFCALGKEPSAVNDFLASYDAAQGAVNLTWSLPTTRPPKDLTIYRGRRGECPERDGKGASSQLDVRPADGRVKDFPGTGAYCYVAVGLNEFGRPGKVAKSEIEIVGEPPVAAFSYFASEGTMVEFYDDSDDPEDDVSTWAWDFGDGTAGSTKENPVHTFSAPGQYEVTLTVTDRGGNTAETSQVVPVGLGDAPEADFSSLQTTGTTAVEFSDFSFDPDGAINAWDWDFGDGSAGSTSQNPVHTYSVHGNYEVTLTVTDDSGISASTTQTVSVIEPGAPIADFDYFQTIGTTVEFFDYSTDDDGVITGWDWDFGDGSAGSTEQEPVHVYSSPGEYEVSLTVTDDDGKTASASYTVFVD